MTNQERAEKVLADWADSEGGLTAIDDDYGGDMTGAAEALADASLLMLDLPKPDLKGGWKTEVIGGGKGFFEVRTPGVVDFVSSAGVYSNTSEMIRREALRMLAAANLAEKSTDE